MVEREDIFEVRESDVVAPSAHEHRSTWRLLRRLCLPATLADPSPGATVVEGLVVDTETTGLQQQRDEVIQLALIPFRYDRDTGQVLSIGLDEAYVGLREPSVPVSPAALAIHGIGADALRGQTIDDGRVQELAEAARLVVAHNANFDRPLVEKHWPVFARCNWGCSVRGVNWAGYGAGSASLSALATRYGFFFDSHDAMEDARATLALLTRTLPDQRQVLAAVRESALRTDWLVRAVDAPHEANTRLRERGYRWRPRTEPGGGSWWTVTGEVEAEQDWLREAVYGGRDNSVVTRITAANRHSARIWNG